MKITIAILNWNGSELLQQFLPTVIKHSNGTDIVVIDNASTDCSLEVLKKEFSSIRVISLSQNHGYAGGYNLGLKQIDTDIVCLLNSDVEVTKDWLKPIVSVFESQANVVAVQPKILDFKRKTYFEYAGASGGYIDKYGFPYCRGRLFDVLEEDTGQYDEETQVFWATGACLFVRKDTYDMVGGLDTDFFAHQEEIDLCWRFFNQGYITKCIPESKVFHVGVATLNEGSPMKTYLNFRNGLFLLVKNLPENGLFTRVFVRMVFDGLAAWRFLLQGKPKHFVAIFKAHVVFYWRLSRFLKKRSGTQREDYFTVKSIVWRFFAKAEKKYTDLFS